MQNQRVGSTDRELKRSILPFQIDSPFVQDLPGGKPDGGGRTSTEEQKSQALRLNAAWVTRASVLVAHHFVGGPMITGRGFI